MLKTRQVIVDETYFNSRSHYIPQLGGNRTEEHIVIEKQCFEFGQFAQLRGYEAAKIIVVDSQAFEFS